jgi:adenosylmethionine-8-amino-7-oxononanoate aminotransferase
MSKSQAQRLKQWDQEYIWHPFTQMKDWVKEEPLIIDSAEWYILKISMETSIWTGFHLYGSMSTAIAHPHIDAASKSR